MPIGEKGSHIDDLFSALATSMNHAYTVRLPAWGGPVHALSVETCRGGGTGRRAGFKIRFPKGSGGSIPPSGTNDTNGFRPFSVLLIYPRATR